ncbi:TetR family transcriptional regulator [Tsukamurella sp. PLM1]|nr:TetR family transcriptional regulator [Tsukamurella sp. PLM1]
MSDESQRGTAPRGRPRDPAIDEAILDATVKALAAHGVAGTSMERVASDAGVSKVTVYARYRTKNRLIGAALEHLQLGDVPPVSGDLERDLARLLAAMRRQYASVGGMSIVGTCLAADGRDAGFLDVVRDSTLRPRRATFVQVLSAAVRDGTLTAGADLELATSMMIGAFYADYLAGTPMDDEWDRRVARAALRGITGE